MDWEVKLSEGVKVSGGVGGRKERRVSREVGEEWSASGREQRGEGRSEDEIAPNSAVTAGDRAAGGVLPPREEMSVVS